MTCKSTHFFLHDLAFNEQAGLWSASKAVRGYVGTHNRSRGEGLLGRQMKANSSMESMS